MQQIKMNMEEKKKLEKIAIQDIESAVSALQNKKSESISKLKEDLVKTPSKEVKALFDLWISSQKAHEKAEKDLKALGFDTQYQNGRYGNEERYTLAMFEGNSYGSSYEGKEVRELKDMRKEFESKIKKAEGLKREVIVGLYTTGVEAQAFLAKLAKQLEVLLG
jgi:hypothetical protein